MTNFVNKNHLVIIYNYSNIELLNDILKVVKFLDSLFFLQSNYYYTNLINY